MTDLLGIIGGVVGIVVFLGAVTVYLRGSFDAGTITSLQKSNAALTERVKILEDSEHALEIKVDALSRENTRLSALRPSAEAIEDLTSFLKTETQPTVKQILTIVSGDVS